MHTVTTVAIPTLNGGAELAKTLSALAAQRTSTSLEVLICDSGSQDGSVRLAREHGAQVIEIAPAEFSHGRTRNLLMERSRGTHVAFLTQDAVPADDLWLAKLVAGFALAADVGLVFGPYRARVRCQPDGPTRAHGLVPFLLAGRPPRIDWFELHERDVPALELLARGASSPTRTVRRARRVGEARSAMSHMPRTICWPTT